MEKPKENCWTNGRLFEESKKGVINKGIRAGQIIVDHVCGGGAISNIDKDGMVSYGHFVTPRGNLVAIGQTHRDLIWGINDVSKIGLKDAKKPDVEQASATRESAKIALGLN